MLAKLATPRSRNLCNVARPATLAGTRITASVLRNNGE